MLIGKELAFMGELEEMENAWLFVEEFFYRFFIYLECIEPAEVLPSSIGDMRTNRYCTGRVVKPDEARG